LQGTKGECERLEKQEGEDQKKMLILCLLLWTPLQKECRRSKAMPTKLEHKTETATPNCYKPIIHVPFLVLTLFLFVVAVGPSFKSFPTICS
jgi:hypothetical protein